jgi:hypothetical protein
VVTDSEGDVAQTKHVFQIAGTTPCSWPTKRVFGYAKTKLTPSPSTVARSKMLGQKWTWALFVGSRLLVHPFFLPHHRPRYLSPFILSVCARELKNRALELEIWDEEDFTSGVDLVFTRTRNQWASSRLGTAPWRDLGEFWPEQPDRPLFGVS